MFCGAKGIFTASPLEGPIIGPRSCVEFSRRECPEVRRKTSDLRKTCCHSSFLVGWLACDRLDINAGAMAPDLPVVSVQKRSVLLNRSFYKHDAHKISYHIYLILKSSRVVDSLFNAGSLAPAMDCLNPPNLSVALPLFFSSAFNSGGSSDKDYASSKVASCACDSGHFGL